MRKVFLAEKSVFRGLEGQQILATSGGSSGGRMGVLPGCERSKEFPSEVGLTEQVLSARFRQAWTREPSLKQAYISVRYP